MKVSGPQGRFANLDVGGSIVTDAAAIMAGGGTIETFDANAGTYIPLEATLQTIAASGQLLVLNGDSYPNDNTLTVHGTIALDQTFLANGRTETFSAPELFVAPDGELTADSGVVSGPVVNDGAILVTLGPLSVGSNLPASGHLVLDSPVTGEGSLMITAGTTAIGLFGPPISTFYISNTLELGAADSENVSFGDNSGSLVLDDPQGFTGTIIPQSFIGTIAPPSGGDTVILSGISLTSITGYSYSGDSAAGILTLDLPSGDLNLQFAGNYVTSGFTLTAGSREFSTSPPSVLITETSVPCLAAGTRVTTVHGDVCVENLIVGDVLATVSGEALPIVWIGKRKISCRRHPRPGAVSPVRVVRDAFVPNRPNRALMLSPDHAVFVDGVLIPVRYLINDMTITQAAVDEVAYYHVELSRHHVLLADGLPVESYLDTGDRVDFGDAKGAVRLFPEFARRLHNVSLVWDGHGFARLVVTGPELDAVRLQLERRARLLRRTVARRA